MAAAVVASFVWERVTAKLRLKGKHVFITGGSTGLGLAIAIKCAQAGALVSIVSRSLENLKSAKAKIEAAAGGRVVALACDATDAGRVAAVVSEAAEAHGRGVDVLVCSAGLAEPGYFLEVPIEQHQRQMNLNYFGTLNAIKAVLPAMVTQGDGHLVLVSSAVALCGMVGYTPYAPSKFALRGLADSLRNELAGSGVRVTIFYPSNMDTPGFATENKTKPKETVTIEGSGSLFTAAASADHLLDGMKLGRYAITDELLTELARMGINGSTPRAHVVLEALLAPLLTVFGSVFAAFMDHVVSSARRKAKQQ